MFLVGELGATISADRKPFDRTLQSVFRDGGRQMATLGRNMTAALTLPLLGAGALAVKTAADYETLEVQINTLAGSAEKGAKIFERLQKFSAGTPFQLADLTRANNILMGMGQTSEEAFDNLQMLGDVASATGSNINELAVTFGQASAEGKLMSRDIREFINRGVPLTAMLADSMGVAKDQIFEMASQGKISYEIVRQALEDATSGTGRYANATEAAANTIGGVLSTMRDNATRFLSEIGDSLVDTFDLKQLMKDFTVQIQTGIDWFNSLSDETRKMGFIMAGVLGAGGPILLAIGTLSMALGALSAPILGVATVVGTASALIIKNWGSVEEYFTSGGGKTMWTDLQSTVKETTKAVVTMFEVFGDDLIKIAEFSFGKVLSTIENMIWAISLIPKAFNITVDALTNVGDAFSTVFGDGEQKVRGSTRSMDTLLESSKKLSDFINTDFSFPEKIRQSTKETESLVEQTRRFLSALRAIKPEIESLRNDRIINPADIANTQAMRDEFRLLNNTLYNAQPLTMDLSHRFEETGDVAEESTRQAVMAMESLGNSIGGVIGQLIKGKKEALSFGNILASVAPALINVLTGGVGGFAGGIISGLSGGFRSNGGPVMAGNSYVVGENGREIFSPGTNGSITPVQTSQGQRNIRLDITGTLVGDGESLRSTINEVVYLNNA